MAETRIEIDIDQELLTDLDEALEILEEPLRPSGLTGAAKVKFHLEEFLTDTLHDYRRREAGNQARNAVPRPRLNNKARPGSE